MLPQDLKKKNPVGWICAIKRPPFSLAKLAESYRIGLKQGYQLPDYLMVLDDDTYVNMEELERSIVTQNISKDTPAVFAGCLVRAPIHIVNFTFPFGGWGAYFSKGALHRLIKPIFCNESKSYFRNEGDEFQLKVCGRIGENLLNEKTLFNNGMSVSDLMGKFTMQNPFCLHADWVFGYFINYYYLSEHIVDNDFYKDVEQARLHRLDNSEIYRKGTGNCLFEGDNCNIKSPICHQLNESLMESLYSQLKILFPHKFKKGYQE
jgi:hypothetical protein